MATYHDMVITGNQSFDIFYIYVGYHYLRVLFSITVTATCGLLQAFGIEAADENDRRSQTESSHGRAMNHKPNSK